MNEERTFINVDKPDKSNDFAYLKALSSFWGKKGILFWESREQACKLKRIYFLGYKTFLHHWLLGWQFRRQWLEESVVITNFFVFKQKFSS